MNIDELVRRLPREHLVHDGLLKAGGERELRAAMDFWSSKGKTAFVVMLPGSEDPRKYQGLWRALRLDPERDLLLICNGREWDVAGWGLSESEYATILESSEAGLRRYWARGLTDVLDRAGHLALGTERMGGDSEPPASDESSIVLGTGVVLGSALLAAVGWTIQRRRAAARRRPLELAFEEARGRFAHVMLEAEELDGESARSLQEGAMSVADELDRLQNGAPQSEQQTKLTLGRVRQLDNELAALNSQALAQRRRERSR